MTEYEKLEMIKAAAWNKGYKAGLFIGILLGVLFLTILFIIP